MENTNTKEEGGTRCYTVKDIQKILCISRPTAYELIKRNEFRTIFVGGRHLISKRSFDAWLDGEAAEEQGGRDS